ncbi:hypothetical protein LLS1_04190 [Leifsonia sp. LS1]|nr:hypothetical protein LLS1_04190 [Leifsonia sp. LS1]
MASDLLDRLQERGLVRVTVELQHSEPVVASALGTVDQLFELSDPWPRATSGTRRLSPCEHWSE